MSETGPKKPQSPWRLNSSRVLLLVLGGLLLIYLASALLGGLTNYQELKEGAKAQQQAPAETAQGN